MIKAFAEGSGSGNNGNGGGIGRAGRAPGRAGYRGTGAAQG